MRLCLILVSTLLLTTVTVRAQTTVGGGLYANTTWTAAGNPYLVGSDLVVFPGVVLTLQPGVQLRVASGKKIEVRGRMVVAGTAANPVSIVGDNATHQQGFWRGIVFWNTSTTSGGYQADFRHCIISDAYKCVDMDYAYSGPYHFRNCHFTHSNQVNEDGGMHGVLFDSCTIANNVTGILHMGFGGSVRNSTFDANGTGAIGLDSAINCVFTNHSQVAHLQAGYTSGCTFTNNVVAVEIGFNMDVNTFINNRVENNSVGVKITSFFSGHTVTGNQFCNNTQYNVILATNNNASVPHNCWCSTDSATIRQKILDGYTDVSRGLVSFSPVINTCSASTTGVSTIHPEANINTIIAAPNPTQAGSILRIHSAMLAEKGAQLRITSSLGQAVPVTVVAREAQVWNVSLAGVVPGVYALQVRNEQSGKHASMRIIVQ